MVSVFPAKRTVETGNLINCYLPSSACNFLVNLYILRFDRSYQEWDIRWCQCSCHYFLRTLLYTCILWTSVRYIAYSQNTRCSCHNHPLDMSGHYRNSLRYSHTWMSLLQSVYLCFTSLPASDTFSLSPNSQLQVTTSILVHRPPPTLGVTTSPRRNQFMLKQIRL